MKLIPLSQGLFAQVDDEDYDDLMKYRWFALKKSNTFYAIRNERLPSGRKTTIRMHRQILGLTDPKRQVDHEDHNGLNCQRSNIRKSTQSQNMMNRTPRKNTSSPYIGVCWDKRDNIWLSYLNVDNRRLNLGSFDNEVEAAKARDRAALIHHDRMFVTLNFPEIKTPEQTGVPVNQIT